MNIGSCILIFLTDYLPPPIKHVKTWSDTCAGQNRNSYMCVALSLAVQQHPTLEIVDQKFLVPGHTFMDVDQCHHQIESKKKKTTVRLHHPNNFYDMVREVGPRHKKFNVREMTQEDILNFEPLVKGREAPMVGRKTDTDGNPFLFGETQWFRFQKATPGIILFKKSLQRKSPFSLKLKRKKSKTCQSFNQKGSTVSLVQSQLARRKICGNPEHGGSFVPSLLSKSENLS